MNDQLVNIPEQRASEAFSRQSVRFDQLYGNDTIVNYKRKRVRDHVANFLQPGSRVLELNAGTGEDALWFARQGHQVHATDIAAGMQQVLINKVREAGLENTVSHELCSYTKLDTLEQPGPYDLIFSNFAGLNCTNELEKVLGSFSGLLKQGGHVTLVILPQYCLWETLLLFRGKFKTAFRRFSGKKGTKAHIEGAYFRCWYYNPSFVQRRMKKDFDVVALEGLCTIVPPSYLEHFAEKHPRWYSRFLQWENRLKTAWPWRSVGDYYIITLRKK